MLCEQRLMSLLPLLKKHQEIAVLCKVSLDSNI